MGSVTGKTAAAMDAIIANTVVGATINSLGRLILQQEGGGTIDAGPVAGPVGPAGPAGPQGPSGSLPTGTIIMFATSGPPAGGWLVCNGAAVSRTTYATLFALIGTKYGAGDNVTTFNVPNFSNRFPRMDASFGTNAGLTGGSDTHNHTAASHDHNLSGGSPPGVAKVAVAAIASPNVFMDRIDGIASWTPSIQMGATVVGGTPANNTGGAALTGHTASTTPGNTGITNNDPPYLNVVFFIKY